MLGSIAYVFGFVLKFWFNILGNYGWAIILFSITIKAILFPLTLKQQKATRKTQELQPKLNELQEKYKDDQQKLSEEYTKFMQENKFNPFGGCLLMILQLFMLLGVLYVVASPMKYMEKSTQAEIDEELRGIIAQEKFSGDKEEYIAYAVKFVDENSGEDMVKNAIKSLEKGQEKNKDIVINNETIYLQYYKLTNRYYELSILKNKYDLDFLGINLGEITLRDKSNLKLWIFPVSTVIFYYLSLWMVSRNQKKNTPKMKDADGNEIEMPNMMTMNITMPLLSGWISASVPQGMGLYWFINSFLQVLIQLFTEFFIKKDKEKDALKTNSEVIIEDKEAKVEDNNENVETLENSDNDDPIKDNTKKKDKNGRNKNASKKKHRK